MECRANVILRYLVDLRSILLGIAIFNLTTSWTMDMERYIYYSGFSIMRNLQVVSWFKET